MDEKGLDIIASCAKEVAKKAYDDGGKPIVKPTGELVGLVPRAIKAALSPIEKWILVKEYNLAETKKLLEIKLQNVDPELIESPEPHIAVPALQYLSYCMNNEELRNMYANLLASSMNASVKDGVHPSFVEIIKQLSPDEAKLLKALYEFSIIPVITVRYNNENGDGISVLKNFSNLGDLTGCEHSNDTEKYFDNLARLGLAELAGSQYKMASTEKYLPLKNHSIVREKMNVPDSYKNVGFSTVKTYDSCVSITAYGKSFCDICLKDLN